MYGKARNYTINPFAGGRLDSHGLRGVHFIEDREQAVLWKSLHAQVTVGRDFADNEAGLVEWCDDQAMRCAAANGDDHVAEIVRLGVQSLQFCANFIAELIFVARNGGRIDKFLKLIGEPAVRTGRLLRLPDGGRRAQKENGE